MFDDVLIPFYTFNANQKVLDNLYDVNNRGIQDDKIGIKIDKIKEFNNSEFVEKNDITNSFDISLDFNNSLNLD